MFSNIKKSALASFVFAAGSIGAVIADVRGATVLAVLAVWAAVLSTEE